MAVLLEYLIYPREPLKIKDVQLRLARIQLKKNSYSKLWEIVQILEEETSDSGIKCLSFSFL